MKRTFLTILFVAFALLSFAQDLITTREGEEIQSKILKISESEIEYKKWDNQDGPTFIMGVDKIFMIKFQNGDKQVFKDEQVAVESASPNENKVSRKNKKVYTNINFGLTTQSLKKGGDISSWTGNRIYSGGSVIGVSWDADIYKGLGLEFFSFGLMIYNETYSKPNDATQVRPYTYLWKFEAVDVYISPIMFQYCYNFENDYAIYVTTGPTVDMALLHKYYYRTVDVDGSVYKDNISYRSGKGELLHFSYVNWDVKLAFRINMLKIQLGTSFGLNNIAWNPDEKVTVKRPFYLVFGINF